MTGYLRTPAIHDDDIVFVSDDDLWHVPATGGRAHRLTSGAGESSGPRFSPDGRLIAFAGREEGPPDVYAMPAGGGPARRLTYHGAGGTVVAGFDPGGDIIYATEAERPFRRDRWLYRISPAGGAPTQLPLGPASVIDYAPGGAVVLGRIVDDPARWKRYRGGLVGDIWIDPLGDGEFRRLVRLPGNVACPCLVGDRVYFISDHEGIGNVYSCSFDGSDLRRHSRHEDFYSRGLSGDGQRLVYTAGARLWIVEDGASREVDVLAVSGATQRARQFVMAGRHLDTVALSPEAARLAVTTRGKAYTFGHFTGPVRQHGEPDGVRYRLLSYLPGGERLPDGGGRLVAAAGDESDHESLVLLDAAGGTRLDVDHGRATQIAVSPVADVVAVANHRCELLLIDLRGEQPVTTVVDRATHNRIEDLTWSRDGAHLAYTYPTAPTRSEIRTLTLDGLAVHTVTAPVLRDRAPAFDPAGRFLYFIGSRELDPVYDELQFEMSFPLGSQVYAVTLRADQAPPFQPAVEAPKAKPETPERPEPTPAPIEIDFDGIDRRVAAVPLPDGVYERLGASRDKLFVLSRPVVGVRRGQTIDDDRPIRRLQSVALPTGKVEDVAGELTGFDISTDGTVLLLRAGERLRVVPSGEKLPDSHEPGPESGWVDLGRVKVSIRPDLEWPQMFREAWRLQRDQFWTEDMSALDWAEIYQRYRPLVDRVATRSELSDLLWELHGELGTSHAYESGGAYRHTPQYAQGHLGVDWAYDAGIWRIGRVLDGDVWSATESSPFARPGVDVRAGDEVVAINGVPVGPDRSPDALLVNQAEQEIEVTVRRGDREPRTFRVTPLAGEAMLRYRDFVDTNRALVHERTGGRVGYLHIPNMMAWGYAEFHRSFLTEYDREALLVDVRWNGGGHVSGLLLQRLARRRIAYGWSRWHQPEPYPDQSPRGPMVMLTNEHAGSDGDIVSHSFKAMGLGPLIGRRTWGGVIGIYPRHKLADGTETTQPEFAFSFDDVGWGVENYGTDPDIEVDNRPQDFLKGFDAQLDRAIDEALAVLEAHPPHAPVQPPRPRFTRPRLP